MSAAKHADVFFVKQKEDKNDLVEYVKKEGIRHIPFTQFGDGLPIVESAVNGQKTTVLVGSVGRLGKNGLLCGTRSKYLDVELEHRVYHT